MSYQTVFQRHEMKYLISPAQQCLIKDRMRDYMSCDKYGKSTICNIYFDTASFFLIRRSIEKPAYKEKLRLRSYGVADQNSTVFAELKKKYKSVVYKRRISLEENEAMEYLCGKGTVADTQISREIDFFLQRYASPQPAVFLSYEREAYYQRDNPDFRITFDENILWRDYDLSLCSGVYGDPILSPDKVLMELKTGTALPLWMTAILGENRIYKTSFSKYENAYRNICSKIYDRGVCYA